MQKVLHPTSKNVYLWALTGIACLVLMAVPSIMQVSERVEFLFLVSFVLIIGYSFFKAMCGIIFNKLYQDGGILSVALLEGCFFVLFLLMILNN